jgi:hypothetical protein
LHEEHQKGLQLDTVTSHSLNWLKSIKQPIDEHWKWLDDLGMLIGNDKAPKMITSKLAHSNANEFTLLTQYRTSTHAVPGPAMHHVTDVMSYTGDFVCGIDQPTVLRLLKWRVPVPK